MDSAQQENKKEALPALPRICRNCQRNNNFLSTLYDRLEELTKRIETIEKHFEYEDTI